MRGLERDGVRLLVSQDDRHEHATFRELPRLLPVGAVLVVNRSAVLPASLPASGKPGEFIVNLSTSYGDGVWLTEPRWSAAEPGPLPLDPGETVQVAGLRASVISAHPGTPRLLFLRFEGDLRTAMARAGSPIRYGYLQSPHPPLSAYQTIFSDRPGSAEMPSAGRPFTPRTLADVRAREIQLATITLHSGVSSLEVETEEVEDHPLYAEPFEVPARTVEVVNRARNEHRPVIAVGTTVVRALESAWDGRQLRSMAGFTRTFVHPKRGVHVVDGILTGFHDPRASHLSMLYAIADQRAVRDAYAIAVREGYLWHEFGDSHLLLGGRPAH
jgi:S-adenosylmethionine:tRNA ribosyltransferase-isomerase